MLNKIHKIFLLDRVILAFKKDYVGYGEANRSDECLKKGYLPILIDYFSPIPNIEDLEKRKVWSKRTSLSGVDFNIKNQLNLIRRIGKGYKTELDTQFPKKNLLNNSKPIPLYHLIREFKPKRIIEISEKKNYKVVSSALGKNNKITGKLTKYHQFHPEKLKLIRKNIFEDLDANDFLYIDLDHYIKIGSAVNYLYLEILPILKPGVIIGIENVALPYEYPKEFITKESSRKFWTEQYLLQAFLMFNREFEVILAMNYLFNDHAKELKSAFGITHDKNINFNRSFWIRRKSK